MDHLDDEADNFLGSLEEDFRNYRPYRGDDEGDVAYNDTTCPKMPSWHEMIRSHMDVKPSMPSSEHNIPRSKNRNALSDNALKMLHDNASHATDDSSEVALNASIRRQKLKDYRESRSLLTVCRSGWNLSKGWSTKPALFSPDIESVQQDIQKFAARFRNESSAPTSPQQYDDIGGDKDQFMITDNPKKSHKNTYLFHKDHFQNTNDSSKKDLSKTNINKVKVALFSDPYPGPRYNIRPDVDFARRSDSGRTKANQRGETKAKDITFGIGPRKSLNPPSQSPGPIYFPNEDYLKGYAKTSPKLYAGGREFFGSIYLDVYSKCSPGPIYSIEEPSKMLSHVYTAKGVVMKDTSSSTDIRSRPKLPPR